MWFLFVLALGGAMLAIVPLNMAKSFEHRAMIAESFAIDHVRFHRSAVEEVQDWLARPDGTIPVPGRPLAADSVAWLEDGVVYSFAEIGDARIDSGRVLAALRMDSRHAGHCGAVRGGSIITRRGTSGVPALLSVREGTPACFTQLDP